MEQDTRGDGRVGSTIIYVAEVSISHKYVFIININFIFISQYSTSATYIKLWVDSQLSGGGT